MLRACYCHTLSSSRSFAVHLARPVPSLDMRSSSHFFQSLPLRLVLVVAIITTRKANAWLSFPTTAPSSAHVSFQPRYDRCCGTRRDSSSNSGRTAPCAGHYRVSNLRMAAGDKSGSGGPKYMGGYYKRPSAAIEKGGGFFVPGLQGSRIRLVFGGVMLGLLSFDGLPRPGMTNSQLVSVTMATLAALALLAQGLLDQRKEQAVQMRIDAIAASSSVAGDEEAIGAQGAAGQEVLFFDTATLNSELEGRLKWAADILLQLTPACSFVAFSEDKVLARVGATGGESDDASLLATASARAAADAEDGYKDNGDYPSHMVTVARSVSSEGTADDDAIMSLLPDVCRQGILCSVVASGGVGGGAAGVVGSVLLGSTLRGAGVFSTRETEWFKRVCVHVAIADGGAPEQ